VTGNVTGNVVGEVTGNSTTASTLQTPRTIAISGAVTGVATLFNGSSNIAIPATIASGATITSPVFAGTATGGVTSSVVQGVTDGSAAAAGVVGELLSASTVATAILSATTANGATFTLTAGNWEIFGNASFNFTGTTVTANSTIVASVGTVSGTVVADQQQVILLGTITTATASPAFALVTPRVNISVTTSTPVYIVVKSPTTSVGTMTVSTVIRARRIR